MSEWRIVPKAGNSYVWELVDKGHQEELCAIFNDGESSCCLPSMEELLQDGCWKAEIVEETRTVVDDGMSSMFRIGSENPGFTPTSVAKSVSGLDHVDDETSGIDVAVRLPLAISDSLFQTGSGKSVSISPSGLIRAKSLLGIHEVDCDPNMRTFQYPKSSLNDFKSPLIESRKNRCAFDQFNSPVLKPSGTKKGEFVDKGDQEEPSATLCDDQSSSYLPPIEDFILDGCWKPERDKEASAVVDDENSSMFRTGSENAVLFTPSSVATDVSVTSGIDVNRRLPLAISDSLFRTGSGKSVSISPSGLIRAKTLLGIHEDSVSSTRTFQYPEASLNEFKSPLVELGKNQCEFNQFNSPVLKSSGIKNGCSGKTLNEFEKYSSQGSNNKGIVPPFTFKTAGGKSLSVSRDALRRAKSLLGDPCIDGISGGSTLSAENVGYDACLSSMKTKISGFSHPAATKRRFGTKTFVSPLKVPVLPDQLKPNSLGENLIEKFNEVEGCRDGNVDASVCQSIDNTFGAGIRQKEDADMDDLETSVNSFSIRKPLGDISNNYGHARMDCMPANCEKKRSVRNGFVSAFKKPRSSKFLTPLSKDLLHNFNGVAVSSVNSTRTTKVFSRYPFRFPRTYLETYLTASHESTLHPYKYTRSCITPEVAKGMLSDSAGVKPVESEIFLNMLMQIGASPTYATREWVTNHIKWIVWKLACYDNQYAARFPSKMLTISNVLEELKYRFEREVNYGHRSAIKRILGGDTSSSSMMVLCISAVYTCKDSNAKLELTDGWYAIQAVLDAQLSVHLNDGKLFVGQKLRIWGAGLEGWVGPVSPLEDASTVSLLLHINGTYKAHWADKLGLCKDEGIPLAFRCIKPEGGPVPRTVVGVTRIYPVLYREKLSNGGAIVRCEKMETNMIQLHNQRRSALVEGIVAEFQRMNNQSKVDVDLESEGAKIYRALENAAEPELLMAEMSSEQLALFSSYQSKIEVLILLSCLYAT